MSEFANGFLKTSEKSFKYLKQTARYDELMAKSFPIARGDAGFWLPLGDLHLSAPNFPGWLETLSKDLLTGQLPPKMEDLKDSSPQAIHFLLTDRFNRLCGLAFVKATLFDEVGHLSLSQFFSLDSVVNNEFVETSLRALLVSLDETLVPSAIAVSEVSASGAGLIGRIGFKKESSKWIFNYSEGDLGKQEILTAGPTISSRENAYVLDASRYGWNGEWSKYIKQFETSFADYIGVKHALSTSSCTGALHIALRALDIGPGDEVIVPEITWVATASAVKYVGATPIFADVERGNWCLDAKKLESYITPKTKCIMPVHTYGHPCDMDEIMRIANKHNIYVVEDAAPAIGAECRGRKVGSYGHFAAFSFQGAKMLVTGEGGMLLTSNPELFKKAQMIWDHGRTPGTFWINEIGYKYKMANILAALGLGQLERIDEQVRAKRRIADWYYDELHDFEGVQLWRESEWAKSIYWMSSLTINPEFGLSRDQFFAELKKRKIDTRPTFPAISAYPMWSDANNPVAKFIGDWGVNLPSGVLLKEHQVRYVARSIREVLTR